MKPFPRISLIVAVDENFGIGKNNDMLWNLPKDMRHFKNTTLGHPVIMGRKTLESFGKPLRGRQNIIVTRNPNYQKEGIDVVHTIGDAIDLASRNEKKEIFIIGGGEIYSQSMIYADRLYLTRVHHTFPEAEVFFPIVDFDEWDETFREKHETDEKHHYAFTFIFLDRKKDA